MADEPVAQAGELLAQVCHFVTTGDLVPGREAVEALAQGGEVFVACEGIEFLAVAKSRRARGDPGS